jgi:Tfp pilus assembly PilM family ATPase
VPICSQDITEGISRSLKVDLTKAEKLKLKYGLRIEKGARQKKGKTDSLLAREAEENRKVFEAAKPILMNLAEEIKKHFRYYQTHADYVGQLPKDKEIEKIILCGRGANLKGITDFLSLELKITVELGNPWINILPKPLKEVPGIPYEESFGYTTALGLALRGIRK